MSTILAVSGNPKELEAIRSTFDGKGYSIVSCDNGITAIEAVKIKPFDLMIITQNMEYMDGGSTLRQIRRIRDSDYCPTIMLMNNMDKSTLENYMSLGVADFVKLPINPVDLRTKGDFILESWKNHTDNLRDYEDFAERKRFSVGKQDSNLSDFIQNNMGSDLMAQLADMMRDGK